MTLPRQRHLGGRLPATALVAGPGPSRGTQVLPPVVALTAVSVAGLAGFAGRVIPHVMRLFAEADDARIVPMSALPGAARLEVIDTVARIALAPVGIAIGLMTAIIGAPRLALAGQDARMTLPRQRHLGGRLPATALVAGPGPALDTQVLPPAAALTAVSVAGLAGFAGRVIPHVVRLFAGADYARIVPMSALLGAAYLVVIDTIARIALAPVEIATGLMTAIIGAPVFLWLVRTRA